MVQFVAMGLVGLLLAILGALLVGRGRNLPGVLGKGFTRGDDLRMKRAPVVYFRLLGGVSGIAGVVLLVMGVAFALRPNTAVLIVVLSVVLLLLIAEVGCAVGLFIVAGRYRLFRWDKP